jgi:GDP-mannose 6-dehydrogenase
MRISVFGLGYVGVVTAACLAKDSHEIIGVDVSQNKVDMINAGQSPITEEYIGELVQKGVSSGTMAATTDPGRGIEKSDMAMICVGTPSRQDGSIDTKYVEAVIRQIGERLKFRTKPFTLVLRSTVIPGTVRRLLIPLLEMTSGKKIGEGIDIVFHPEFLREGSSVRDFYAPPKIVIGERLPGTGKDVTTLYEGFEAPIHFCPIEVAEMVKYSDNLFHAVKITFANEIGMICQSHGIDPRQVMEIFCSDTKLNISPAYLKPGFAFGGSCLPKDMRAILCLARECNVRVPMLENTLESNRCQLERVLNLVANGRSKTIGFHGLAFKPGTDDLRESPLVELAERLLGKGFKLKIWDEFVQINRLVGKNRAAIEERLPHLADLMVNGFEQLTTCDTILIGHPIQGEYVSNLLQSGIRVIDLTGANQFLGDNNYLTVV